MTLGFGRLWVLGEVFEGGWRELLLVTGTLWELSRIGPVLKDGERGDNKRGRKKNTHQVQAPSMCGCSSQTVTLKRIQSKVDMFRLTTHKEYTINRILVKLISVS